MCAAAAAYTRLLLLLLLLGMRMRSIAGSDKFSAEQRNNTALSGPRVSASRFSRSLSSRRCRKAGRQSTADTCTVTT